ncbi:hypothetical protein [Streptomyces sp. 184]|uniref:hypothetical protein n=1 Tax=Streptomyces sp. 184 TaxID=1827526 RepID=UPI003892BF7C
MAMQFHLTSLFVAQCGAKPGKEWRNNIPLEKGRNENPISWLDLIAVSAKSREKAAQISTYTGNKLRQFRSALENLAEKGLVDLGEPGTGSRYEGFKLLKEDGSSSGAGAAAYRVPAKSEPIFSVPPEFFINGWVHVLTKSEIAAYLMWLQLGAFHDFITAEWKVRAGMFGLSREVYDTHQALAAFGLIEVDKPDERRRDGTWVDYKRGDDPLLHRIKALPDGPKRNAYDVTHAALLKFSTCGEWSPPLTT